MWKRPREKERESDGRNARVHSCPWTRHSNRRKTIEEPRQKKNGGRMKKATPAKNQSSSRALRQFLPRGFFFFSSRKPTRPLITRDKKVTRHAGRVYVRRKTDKPRTSRGNPAEVFCTKVWCVACMPAQKYTHTHTQVMLFLRKRKDVGAFCVVYACLSGVSTGERVFLRKDRGDARTCKKALVSSSVGAIPVIVRNTQSFCTSCRGNSFRTSTCR